MAIKKWILFICPQPQVVVTYGGLWVINEAITDEKLLEYGIAKRDKAQKEYNKGKRKSVPSVNYYKNRRRSLRKYYDYKSALRHEAARCNFNVPQDNFWLKFFVPMPQSWSQKKKNEMCFELHRNKSDIDNLCKAFFDSLVPKDQVISDYRATKWWYDGTGHIEITVGELPVAAGYTTARKDDLIR